MDELQPIQTLIASELSRFRCELETLLCSEVELVNQISAYILEQQSKHIRPLLVLLSARLFGAVTPATITAAVTVETLHTATLIHDDVVDESLQRRGQPSVNALWDNKIAVLMGDFLFSKALQAMLKIADPAILKLFAQTTERLSEGELLQQEQAQSRTMTEKIYYDMIWAKTASLLATSCKVGALTVNAPAALAEALYEYGRQLGLAFQIKDDLFDLVGAEYRIGKPIGRDLKSNLITLPLIYTLDHLEPTAALRWRAALKKRLTDQQVTELQQIILNTGGIAYAEQQMHTHSLRAREALTPLPDSPFKEALLALTTINENRAR